jgi:hypothetical protein
MIPDGGRKQLFFQVQGYEVVARMRRRDSTHNLRWLAADVRTRVNASGASLSLLTAIR